MVHLTVLGFLLTSGLHLGWACNRLPQQEAVNRRTNQPVRILTGDDPPGQSFQASKALIDDLIGPFAEEEVVALRGGGLAVENARDLRCGFEKRCCWHNVAGGSDDLEWAIVLGIPDEDKARRHFGVGIRPEARPDFTLPTPPFAATAARKTHSFTYSFIVSCPILCQNGPGSLSFDHWFTPSVTLDICVLPLKIRNFTHCSTVKTQVPVRQQVPIPPQSEPFVIIIVASEFTQSPGGMAALDNLEYSGNVCPSPKGGLSDLPSVKDIGLKVASKEEFPFGDVCRALVCDFETKGSSSTCSYRPVQDPQMKQFVQRRKRTGNYAAGVPFGRPKNEESYYMGARLGRLDAAAMETMEFSLSRDVFLEFDFFEAAHGVDLEVCINDYRSNSKCETVSEKGVRPEHRRWRNGRVRIRKGTRKVYFVARNHGNNLASVGIGQLSLSTVDARTINCARQKIN